MRSKKNKKKLLIAITLGMVATMGVFSMINSQKAEVNELSQKLAQQSAVLSNAQAIPNPAAQQELEMSNTILAKADIRAGEMITNNKIERKEYKKSELPANFFPNENYVLGKIASQDILAGKIITSEDIITASATSLSIPSGMRAITIPTSLIQGLASYIYIGSKIDLVSVKSPPEFIAQNVKIVALEATPGAAPDAAAPPPAQPAQPAQPNQPGQPVASAAPAASATPPITNAVSKNSISADKAAGITILVPTITARKVIDAMIAGKLQVLTRGNNDDKIINIKRTYSSHSSHISPLTTGSILPPPPSGTGRLPSLPGAISSTPPLVPEQPKVGVEVIEANNKRQVTFDDSSGVVPVSNTSSTSSRNLKDLLNPLN